MTASYPCVCGGRGCFQCGGEFGARRRLAVDAHEDSMKTAKEFVQEWMDRESERRGITQLPIGPKEVTAIAAAAIEYGRTIERGFAIERPSLDERFNLLEVRVQPE